jgi:putative toxin-antitoxin system antitoxin component (TIGR02293 family)
LDDLADILGVSRATLHRRKAEKKLTARESEKVLRFRRIIDQASRIFADAASARQWLKFPQAALGGAVPLQYARTELGAREVEDLLGRLDHGVYS